VTSGYVQGEVSVRGVRQTIAFETTEAAEVEVLVRQLASIVASRAVRTFRAWADEPDETGRPL
jgi:hypothetical protein